MMKRMRRSTQQFHCLKSEGFLDTFYSSCFKNTSKSVFFSWYGNHPHIVGNSFLYVRVFSAVFFLLIQEFRNISHLVK